MRRCLIAGEASVLLEQVLAVCDQVLGELHPNTLKTRVNLGRVYRDLGCINEAVVMHEQAHAGLLQVLGESH